MQLLFFSCVWDLTQAWGDELLVCFSSHPTQRVKLGQVSYARS